MIEYRPCGACGELVPAATGCKHWTPGRILARNLNGRERAKRREAAASAKVAELIQETGRTYDDR